MLGFVLYPVNSGSLEESVHMLKLMGGTPIKGGGRISLYVCLKTKENQSSLTSSDFFRTLPEKKGISSYKDISRIGFGPTLMTSF